MNVVKMFSMIRRIQLRIMMLKIFLIFANSTLGSPLIPGSACLGIGSAERKCPYQFLGIMGIVVKIRGRCVECEARTQGIK